VDWHLSRQECTSSAAGKQGLVFYQGCGDFKDYLQGRPGWRFKASLKVRRGKEPRSEAGKIHKGIRQHNTKGAAAARESRLDTPAQGRRAQGTRYNARRLVSAGKSLGKSRSQK